MAGNALIGALRVALGLDTAQFETGLKKAKGGLSSFARDAAAAGAAAGTAFAGASAALGVMSKGAIDAADELAKTSQKIGVSVEELSRLKHAADLSDVSLAALATGLKKLSQNMADVSAGSGEAARRAFEALGISVVDSEGKLKSNTEVLREVADKFAGLEDGVGKTAAAVGIFGRSGADLIPLLNSGSAGLAEMAAEADKLGLTIDTKTARSAEAFNDNLTRLDGVKQGLVNTVTAQLLPALVDLSEHLVRSAEEGGILNDAVEVLGAGLGELITYVDDTVTALDAARQAFRNAKGDADDLQVSIVTLGDIARVTYEAVAVFAANLGYMLQQSAQQIGSAVTKAQAFLRLDFKAYDAEVKRHKASSLAARAAIDAFSESLINGGKSTAELNRYLAENADSLERKRAMDEASAAEQERLYGATQKTTESLQFLGSGHDKAGKAARDQAKAEREAEQSLKALQSQAERTIQALETRSETYLRETQENMLTLRKALDAGVISAEDYADAIERIWQSPVTASSKAPPGVESALRKPAETAIEAWDKYLDQQAEDTEAALERMGRSFKGFFLEWVGTGKANWQRLLLDMIDDWRSTMSALNSLGGKLGSSLSGIVGALGKSAGSLGTSIGQVIGQGLGLGTGNPAADLGLSLGGAALGSIAGTALIDAASMGALGAFGSSGLAFSVGGLLGPIGAIAGLALGSLLKSKPSNQGALATFSGDGYAIGGNKRSAETEAAAKAAADAVLQGQDLLEAAGIKLLATVQSIDIGVRDRTDILLSDGRALTAAVGDPADAAETALLALLDGASYVSDAQKSLVESLKAAGKGFDEIAAALNGYAAAQQFGAQFQSAILQLTDPQAYARAQLEAQQGERRAQVQAAADAGYLTAEQLAELNAQLSRLEALELDQVMGRAAEDLAGAVDQATNDLRSAYEAQVAAIQAQLDDWKAIGSSLESFRRSLTKGSLSGLSLQQQAAAAKALYDKTVAGVRSGDKASLEAFPDVAQAWLEAFRAVAPDSDAYARVLGDVKANTAAAEAYAAMQVSSAEAQLAALETMVEKLIDIDTSIQDGTAAVVAAISALGTALTAQAAAVNDNAAPTLPEWFDWRQYAADNPDLAEAYAKGTALSEFGSLQEAIEQHYLRIGMGEIAAGTRKYANGGGFRVGGFGATDSQLVAFRASPQEFVDIYHGSAIARIDANLNSLGAAATNRAMETRLSRIEGSLRAMERIYRRWDGDGQPPERVV